MVMKSVKNANYTQIDHKEKIISVEGVEIEKISEAAKKYKWIKNYIQRKPSEGYFIWVKKTQKVPLLTCMQIASSKVKQSLDNLIVIEPNISAVFRGICSSKSGNLSGSHVAKGKIVLRENSALNYGHLHSWGKDDVVITDYEFLLEKSSKLVYNYKSLSSPKNLSLISKIVCNEFSSADIELAGVAENSKIEINDQIILKGKMSSGMLKLRFAGKENSIINSKSTIVAEAEGKGHLDCQGLPVNKSAVIILTPEIVCKNNQAQITHEASIGKISEEELFYLQSRGLTETEAINLIINGFLEV